MPTLDFHRRVTTLTGRPASGRTPRTGRGAPGRLGGLRRWPAAAVVLGLAAAGAAPAGAHVATPAQPALRPVADAYVVRGAPRRAHGRATTLRVGPSRATRAYLRFRLPAGEVRTAALRVYTRARTRGRLVVRAVRARGRWSERRVRRRPAPGRTVAASPRLRGRGWTVLDVTSVARPGRRLELVLLPRRGARLRIASRESSRPPRLVLDGGGAGQSPPPARGPSPGIPAPPAPGGGTTPSDPPLIAGAGDIANDEPNPDAEKTAQLLDGLNPDTVVTTGDNAYESGTAQEYQTYYEPTWGRHKAKTRPVPGNHEYITASASGYFGYFGAAAGDPAKGYYAYDLGAWRLYALNSNCSKIAGGCGASGAQVQWLRADLAANPRRCVLAYWHHPRFTAGNYSDDMNYVPFWQALYDAGADVVLAGHDHNYQHYRPMRPDGTEDAARGLREFVIGTGGKSPQPIDPDPRRVNGSGTTLGVLALALRPDGYDWRFVAEAGGAFSDSGSDDCH